MVQISGRSPEPSIHQVKPRVFVNRIISRWGVHQHISLTVGNIGMIEMSRYPATRYIIGIITVRPLVMNMQNAESRHVGTTSEPVIWINHLHAINDRMSVLAHPSDGKTSRPTGISRLPTYLSKSTMGHPCSSHSNSVTISWDCPSSGIE